jgi:integration host factor subunit beta
MKKSELIDNLADRTKLTHRQAESAVMTIFGEMANAIIDGERIELRGFGSFDVKNYRAYDGRNPSSGAVIAVPKKRLPVFRVGKELKERLRRGDEPE